MRRRYLTGPLQAIAFANHKMAFLSGPRQCGKTTLGKILLKQYGQWTYHNWDDIAFRRLWAKDPKKIVPEPKGSQVPLIVLDEIHKAKGWKRSIKGLYDTLNAPVDILVTGSARLNVYKKGGDSLLGRYYNFRLHPFSLAELMGRKPVIPDLFLKGIIDDAGKPAKLAQVHLESLLKFGGFPEPILGQDEKRARLWRRQRVEMVIREDLRDLSRIPALSQIEMLAALLPERIGSLLSLNSLREDLEVSYDTIKRWLNLLSELYYIFRIQPYSQSIKRSLKKESKLYLWDYSEIESKGARFENLVAAHLLKACHYWTDTGEGIFELRYLRNREKQEIDFLITRDNKPWLPIEVKSQSTQLSPAWKKFFPMLPCEQGFQLVASAGTFKRYQVAAKEVWVVPACQFLAGLV